MVAFVVQDEFILSCIIHLGVELNDLCLYGVNVERILCYGWNSYNMVSWGNVMAFL